MKNICFFNSAVAWGGGEKWHLEASTYMHDRGHTVLAIAHKKSELLQRLKVKNIPNLGMSIGNLSFLNPFCVNALKKTLRSHNIDTIVINLSRDVKVAALAAKKANVARIIYRRGSAIPIKNSFLNRYYFKNIITDVLANSEATKKTVLQNNKKLFPENKIKVIYNAIACDLFKQSSKSDHYSEKNNQEIVLTNLGRIEFQKNQKFLIYLAEELKKRKILFKLIIGGDGRLKQELQQLSIVKGVEKEISFPGFIKNPEAFLKSGNIFVLSSLWEGFGYVLAEAALCEKPIIAFDTSSNPEVVVHNKTGILTPLNEVAPFADAVEFLAKNPGIRKEMGKKGKEYIENKFDKKTILKNIEHYLIHGQ